MSLPDPYKSLRQNMGSPIASRAYRKIAVFSSRPVTKDTQFRREEVTYLSGQGQEVATEQVSQIFSLTCGCNVMSPSEIRGICPGCALSWRVRLFRLERYVCHDHRLCLHCRRRRLSGMRSSFFALLVSLLVWPLFDVVEEEDEVPRPPFPR